MTAQKFIALNNGAYTEKSATVVSSGAGNAGDIPALNDSGRLDESVMPTNIGSDTKTGTASEALAAGDFVNFWNNSGTVGIRKADATGTGEGKRAHGFVKAGVSSGATATVYLTGINPQLTGLTPGTTYYLSTTAGGITATAPAASGNIVQEVGCSLSATEISFYPSKPIQVA